MIYGKCPVAILLFAVPLFVRAAADEAVSLTHPLTVLMDFEAPHSEASLKALRHSLQQLLSPSGFVPDIQLMNELPEHAQFGSLVVFKMRGSCDLTPLPVGALSDERGPLAMAYTSDGEVLHFGEVECDRVRRSVQRFLGRNASLKNQQSYGSALAIVMAHEVYHMLGNEKRHTHKGVTKAELSGWELLDPRPSLPGNALESVKKALPGGGVGFP